MGAACAPGTIGASIACQGVIGKDKFVVVEAVELWKTRRGFSKPCGKAALPKGWLSIERQIYSWVRRGCRGRRGKVLPQPASPRRRSNDWHWRPLLFTLHATDSD
jgi:hypothetical protein